MKLRYVKTLDEVRRLRALYAAPAFERFRGLSAVFRTDPEVIAALLPPPLEPADELGRELYGEPKKVADIRVRRDGDETTGTIERYGIAYIEIRGRAVERLRAGPSRETSRFYFKFMPAPDGCGFDNDPVLVRVRHTGSTRLVERLEGELLLREAPHDPVADVPVRELLGLTYSEGDTYTRGEILARVPGESFLPYMFGKIDDLELLAGEAAD